MAVTPRAPSETSADARSSKLEDRRGLVLTKAALRAAGLLDMSQRDLGLVLGVSDATVSRMKDGLYRLEGKPFELAALFVRSYRSLDALLGGQAADVKAWFHADNSHLQGTPAALVGQVEGLVRVAEYLDAMRGAQ